MKTIRIPLELNKDGYSFEHQRCAESFYICEYILSKLFDLQGSRKIDLVISDKKTKNSYEVLYDTNRVYFKDIKSEPRRSEITARDTDYYMQTYHESAINRIVYISVEI